MNTKLRNALEEIIDMGTCYFPDFTLPEDDDELQDAIVEKAPDYTSLRDDFIKAVIIARTALAEPPRNCDVGAAEEQEIRFSAFCLAHRMQSEKGCTICPCHTPNEYSCEFVWSQLPYEPVETKTKTNKGE